MTNFCKEEIGVDVDVKAYRILVRAPFYEERTKSGLFITSDYIDDIRKTANVGKVVKIGSEAFTNSAAPFKVSVGDWIVYSKYEREPFLATKKQFLCYFINDDRILASLSEEDALALLEGGK